MCPRPGTMLNITATASLALASAVCVAPRTQSQRSQRSASFCRRCPQYGHGILSPVVASGAAVGASVYSTFILLEGHKSCGIRQTQRRPVIIPYARIGGRGLPVLSGLARIFVRAATHVRLLCPVSYSVKITEASSSPTGWIPCLVSEHPYLLGISKLEACVSYQAPNLIYICCGENLLCYS